MRGIFARAAALAAAALLLAGCGGREETPAAKALPPPGAPLVLAVHPTTPPCCWTNAAGECLGADVELGREIAARLGRPLRTVPMAFEEIIPAVKRGDADCGIATITITEARKADVDFSRPYAIGGNCFLYRKGAPRPKMSRLARARVGVETSTTGDLYLCSHGCDPVRFDEVGDAVAALEAGKIDSVFFDMPPLKAFAEKSGGRLLVSPLFTREGYGVAVNKGRRDVLEAAEAAIAARGAGK